MKKFFLNIIVLLLGMASCYAQNHAAATNRKDFLRGVNNFATSWAEKKDLAYYELNEFLMHFA